MKFNYKLLRYFKSQLVLAKYSNNFLAHSRRQAEVAFTQAILSTHLM